MNSTEKIIEGVKYIAVDVNNVFIPQFFNDRTQEMSSDLMAHPTWRVLISESLQLPMTFKFTRASLAVRRGLNGIAADVFQEFIEETGYNNPLIVW